MNDFSEFFRIQNEQIQKMMKPLLMVQRQSLIERAIMPSVILENAFYPILNSTKQFINNSINLQMESINCFQEQLSKVFNSNNILDGISFNLDKLRAYALEHKILDDGILYLEKKDWTYPFEFEIKDLDYIMRNKRRFNSYIVKHFNNERINKLFSDCIRYSNKKDYVILLKQVKRAYFNNDYALCIIGIISCFESLFLDLNLKTGKTKKSHKGYEIIEDTVSKLPEDYQYHYFLQIKKLILFGNYITNNLYCNVDLENSKLVNKNTNKSIIVTRHSELHGKRFVNNKYECIKLINSLGQFTEILSVWYDEG